MNKKILLGSIIAVAIIILSSFSSVLAKDNAKNRKKGEILYVGGDGPGNYTKIQDAIDNSSDGDTVFVYDDSSPYYENLIVDKSISLIGEDKNNTVIDARSSGNNIVVENAHYVVISGFTMQNATFSLFLWNTCKYSIIYDNIIRNNTCDGITLYCSYSIIRSNIIKNNGQSGISCSNPTYGYSNEISQNIIHNNEDDGIFLCSDGNNITENTITENNLFGIWLSEKSSNNSIYHNNIINNTQNAYDEGGNIWDDGYPSGGNYWDDYDGIDNNWGENQNINGSDGIGDTPYNIFGEDNQDRYPLIEPYGMTKLTFSMGPGLGLFKFSGIIKNIGNKTAFNVQWKITIDGGFIIVGRHSSGTLPKGRIMITIAVWADNAPLISESIPGTLFLIFLML